MNIKRRTRAEHDEEEVTAKLMKSSTRVEVIVKTEESLKEYLTGPKLKVMNSRMAMTHTVLLLFIDSLP